MTVGELIEQLSKLPQDLEVQIPVMTASEYVSSYYEPASDLGVYVDEHRICIY